MSAHKQAGTGKELTGYAHRTIEDCLNCKKPECDDCYDAETIKAKNRAAHLRMKERAAS